VILYSGALKEGADDVVIQEARRRGRAENVILVICTLGGAADPAYRIARFLRNRYKHFTVLVHGFCKSAGTLLALGADELAMSDLAELGPLDVQLRKQDEYEVSSGLAVTAALTALEQQAFEAFKSHFMRTKVELGLSTRLASDIATNLAVGLFKEMYAQLDPVRLGEIARAVRIAADYGERLTDPSRCNPKPGTLDRLVTKYPAHRFVIDRREAAELFAKVRYPSATELRFIEHVDFATRTPLASDAQDPIVLFFPQPA
jgi:hypothetical protein